MMKKLFGTCNASVWACLLLMLLVCMPCAGDSYIDGTVGWSWYVYPLYGLTTSSPGNSGCQSMGVFNAAPPSQQPDRTNMLLGVAWSDLYVMTYVEGSGTVCWQSPPVLGVVDYDRNATTQRDVVDPGVHYQWSLGESSGSGTPIGGDSPECRVNMDDLEDFWQSEEANELGTWGHRVIEYISGYLTCTANNSGSQFFADSPAQTRSESFRFDEVPVDREPLSGQFWMTKVFWDTEANPEEPPLVKLGPASKHTVVCPNDTVLIEIKDSDIHDTDYKPLQGVEISDSGPPRCNRWVPTINGLAMELNDGVWSGVYSPTESGKFSISCEIMDLPSFETAEYEDPTFEERLTLDVVDFNFPFPKNILSGNGCCGLSDFGVNGMDGSISFNPFSFLISPLYICGNQAYWCDPCGNGFVFTLNGSGTGGSSARAGMSLSAIEGGAMTTKEEGEGEGTEEGKCVNQYGFDIDTSEDKTEATITEPSGVILDFEIVEGCGSDNMAFSSTSSDNSYGLVPVGPMILLPKVIQWPSGETWTFHYCDYAPPQGDCLCSLSAGCVPKVLCKITSSTGEEMVITPPDTCRGSYSPKKVEWKPAPHNYQPGLPNEEEPTEIREYEYDDCRTDGPTKMTIVDPDDPNHRMSTTYEYDELGRLISMTGYNGITAQVGYDTLSRATKLFIHDGTEVLKEYHYNYFFDGSTMEEIDEVPHPKTEVRELLNPGTIPNPVPVEGLEYYRAINSGTESDSDRISEYVYYRQDDVSNANPAFIRRVRDKWMQDNQWHWATVDYDRDRTYIVDNTVDNERRYGRVTKATYRASDRPTNQDPDLDQLVGNVEYEYYEGNTEYVVPTDSSGAMDQYAYTTGSGASVALAAGTGTYTVQGNGEVKSVTVTLPSGASYTSYGRYYVRTGTDGSLTMAPDLTMTSDDTGFVSKAVLNPDGSVASAWETDETGQMAELGSATYCGTGDNPKDKGRLKTLTLQGVASSGAPTNLSVAYEHLEDLSETITGTMNGRSAKVHIDKRGRLTWDEDEEQRRTDYDYDWRGRLTKATVPPVAYDGEEEAQRKFIEAVYDCCHLTDLAGEDGKGVHFHYDKWGRVDKAWTDLQSETSPLVECTYGGPFGAVDTVTVHEGTSGSRTTNYFYNGDGSVRRVEHPEGENQSMPNGPEEYSYDDLGAIKSYTDGNGDVTCFEYSENDKVYTSAVDYKSQTNNPPGFVADVTYTLDESDPAEATYTVSETIAGQAVESVFSYDRLSRLVSYTPPVPAGYGSITYTWTKAGQKESMTVPTGDGDSARKFIYKYDNESKLTGTAIETVTGLGGTPTALSPQFPDQKTHFYSDDDGNRVKMVTKAGEVYYFVYDPTASVPAVVYEQAGKTNGSCRYINVRGPGGDLLSRERYNASGTRDAAYTYHYDGLGSTIALTDSSGAVVQRYSYDAWGGVTPSTPLGVTDNPYQYVGQLGYYTHYQEPTLSLLQLGFRYYDPGKGRFTQQDPIGDGLNWYVYCGGNPMGWVDPWGLQVSPTPFWPPEQRPEGDPTRPKVDNSSAKPVIGLPKPSNLTELIPVYGPLKMAEYEGSWRNTKGAMGHVAWAVVDIAGFGEGGLAKGAAKKVVSKVAAKIVEKRSVAKTLLSEVDEAAECAVSASKRRVPNPHGKLGSPQHREKVAEVLADMRSRGLAVDTEVPFKIPGGTKDIRYADAVGYRDGVVAEVHQVGRIGKRVGPVKREREAINDLLRAKDNPLMKIIFHPYN